MLYLRNNIIEMAFQATADMIADRTSLTTLITMDITIVTVETILMTGIQTLSPITQMKNPPTILRLKTLLSPRVKAMRTNSI